MDAVERNGFAFGQHGQIARFERDRKKTVDHRSLQIEPTTHVAQSRSSAALGVSLYQFETIGSTECGSHLPNDGIAAIFLLWFLTSRRRDVRHVRVMRCQGVRVYRSDLGYLSPLIEDELRRHHRDRSPDDAATS